MTIKDNEIVSDIPFLNCLKKKKNSSVQASMWRLVCGTNSEENKIGLAVCCCGRSQSKCWTGVNSWYACTWLVWHLVLIVAQVDHNSPPPWCIRSFVLTLKNLSRIYTTFCRAQSRPIFLPKVFGAVYPYI